MTTRMQSLGIDQLSRDEQLDLALEIWDNLGENPVPNNLTATQRETIVRRKSELENNPQIAITWEQIRQRVEG